ncbi:MAG TPA: phytanoyl-CoA dioxygenase family protein [Acidimicrobiales bacterium]|nr:phytanoyl-CoA dioxygenase family protein [Acidimicrobiales bacterium]
MTLVAFHEAELPALLASGNGTRAARALHPGDRIAFASPGGASYTYRCTGADIAVSPGVDADAVVELDDAAFDDLVTEAWSVYGLLYGDRVRMRAGDFVTFATWEAPLQALWFGRPVYDDAAVAALGAVDVHRSYTLDDEDADLAAFLATAGFLVLRGVLSPEEVGALNGVVAEERAKAAPGDGRSWWATRQDGAEVCCRLTYMAERSPLVKAFATTDARFRRIAALADPALVPCTDRLDGVSVVIKNPAVVAGLSDLPWHRDCGVGGHRALCPGLNVGLQLDRADAANGQLHFLAGSHHHAAQQGPPPGEGAPVVAVDAAPGDVTVHFGHTLHAAPPPTSPTAGRKALYIGYHLPPVLDVVGPGRSYNDVLVSRDGGRVKSVDEVVAG